MNKKDLKPGTKEAAAAGCSCGRDQPQAFQGLYWMHEDCELHGIPEEWKEIKGFEGKYEVSDKGRIRSLTRTAWNGVGEHELEGQVIKDHPDKKGYRTTSLCKDGEHRPVKVHREVGKAFLPNPEDKPCINHKDGDKGNNKAGNLEWCTYSENNRHAWDTGLMKSGDQKGEANGRAILTEEKVKEIRAFLGREELSQGEIGKMFGVSKCAIGDISRGKTWRHLLVD